MTAPTTTYKDLTVFSGTPNTGGEFINNGLKKLADRVSPTTNNVGAVALTTVNLSTTPTVGDRYSYYVDNVNGVKIVAAGAAKIRAFDQLSIANGYIQSTNIGSYIQLEYVAAGLWVAQYITGIWDIEIS